MSGPAPILRDPSASRLEPPAAPQSTGDGPRPRPTAAREQAVERQAAGARTFPGPGVPGVPGAGPARNAPMVSSTPWRRRDLVAAVERDGPASNHPAVARMREFVDRPMTVRAAVAEADVGPIALGALVRLVVDGLAQVRDGWSIRPEGIVTPSGDDEQAVTLADDRFARSTSAHPASEPSA